MIERESDYALTLRNVVRGTRIGKPRHVASNLAQVAFSADGETLAAIEDDKATLWSTRRQGPSARPFRVVGDSAIAVSNGARLTCDRR